MAFVVEDGTGLANATSLIEVVYFRSYWQDRGVTFSEADDVIQPWLIQGTDYIGTFNYKSCKLNEDQACAFPREDFGFPENIKKACAEYARRAKDGPLAPDPTIDASGYQVSSTSKKVGPIEKSVSFATGAGARMMTRRPYPSADVFLRGYVMSTSRVIR